MTNALKRYMRHPYKWAAIISISSACAVLPACVGDRILALATPVLLDGGNGVLTRLISLVAPLVLP